MRTPAATWWALVALWTTAVSGCRQIVGIDDREATASVGCDLPPMAADCRACVEASCCSEASACMAEDTCRAALACSSACDAGDSVCQSACADQATDTALLARVRACRATHCDAACGLVCGGAGLPGEGCDACADACCELEAACWANEDCGLLRTCRVACSVGDGECRAACEASHPRGTSVELAFTQCRNAACGVVMDWSCVGEVQWPSEAGGIVLDVRPFQGTGESLQPQEGVVVAACDAQSTSCRDAVSGPEVTNSSGLAQLDLGTPFSGYVELTRDDITPTLYYFYPPLNQSTERLLRVHPLGSVEPPGTGALILTARDCRGRPASGVVVTIDDPEAVITYLDELSTDITTTTDGGLVALENLTPRLGNLTATVASTCQTIGELNLVVRADSVTFSDFPPTPR